MENTHSRAIYLVENRYDKPKEQFVAVADLLLADLRADGTVGDFGCAAGEFLYHVVRRSPGLKCQGFDVAPELLEKARRFVPEGVFSEGSILDPPPAGTLFDRTTLMGVMSFFDDFRPALANLLGYTAPGGRAYVFGLVNDAPVDVWVKYRRADSHPLEHREGGWNVHSKYSISAFLESRKDVVSFRFLPFQMSFDLPKQDDPVRTWTFADAAGQRLFTNGLSLLQNLQILEVVKR